MSSLTWDRLGTVSLPDEIRRDNSPDVELTSPTSRRRIHEVFLSFRGEDTRASFTSHLYAALQNAGVNVFRDDDSLRRGDQITSSLLQAIEDSQISVIVFSINYANSRWCMEELDKIMECHRTIGQVVLPVFYGVDPSEVRRQTGEFGNKFQDLTNRITALARYCFDQVRVRRDNLVPSWREALSEAGGIAGFVVLNSRNESETIDKVVENVTRLLNKTDLFIADNPVGVESRVRDIIQLVDNQELNDVLLLRVWGMGGIGKTTIAKAIYNEVGRNFEGRSFLANIREAWEQDAGQVHLQEQLLFDIFNKTATKIHNMESGKSILKDRLCSKRVLLVLDDMNNLDQLNALCGSRDWFGSGSRIIITTRDKNILRGNRVDRVYSMKKMDESESIELFSWNAFKQASPGEDFAEISRNVVEYSGGLPLALEVLGSYLFDRGETEWKSVLEKLKRIPNNHVQKKLKISYDGLNDDTEKEIFLDIACFFIGMDRNDAIQILNGCGLFAEIGINVLVERSLVTVDDKNKLGMHDLLRDMGREIILEESPKEPEKRSRLWFHEDVLGVLSDQTRMEMLKILNLSHSQHLTKTPDFSNLPNLEKLVLRDCPSLSEVSPSIGHLNKVVLINLKDCIRLRNLPRSIYKLKSLKTLILSGCLMIDKLEEDVEQMESLTTLIADNTAITRVPYSLVRSKSIGYISLCGHEGFSRDVFPSIIWSWMSLTSNLSSLVQTYTGMSSLVSLNVSNSSSEGLSSIPVDLPKLQSLWIESGSELQLSQDAERILDALYATNSSKNLELTATTSEVSNMETTALMECSCQVHDSESKGSLKCLLFQMGMNCLATSILKESILQKMAVRGTGVSLLPEDNYPDWLIFNCEGSSVIFEVPEVNGRSLKSMMCVVHSSIADDTTSDGLKNVLVINCTKNTIQLYKRNALASFEDEEWQRVVSNIEPGNKLKVVVVFENRFTVKKTTIYLIYVEPIEEKVEYCNAPSDEIESDVWRSSAHVESKDACKQKQKRRKIE